MIISLAQPKLHNINKKGILKPDENGYYETVLGALDIKNSANELYPYKGNEGILDEGSPLRRRIENGQLYAEMGHPTREAGMSNSEWLTRYIRIEPTRICAHIKEVWLDPDYVTNTTGERFVAIIGLVKPIPPYGDAIEEYLKTPDINVAWSVRSFTRNIRTFSSVVKYFTEIRNWDFVLEPGIKVATKWDSPSLEENKEDNLIVTPELLNSVHQNRSCMTMLSGDDNEILDNVNKVLSHGSQYDLNKGWNTF